MARIIKTGNQSAPIVNDTSNSIRMVFLVIATLLSTFFLIFLEKTILPWPWLVEELVKAAIIFWLIAPMSCTKCRLLGVVVAGLVFSVTENIFYFLNFIDNNQLAVYWQRFVWPLAMHLLTITVMLFSIWKNKSWLWLGLWLAILIHWYYNSFLVNYL